MRFLTTLAISLAVALWSGIACAQLALPANGHGPLTVPGIGGGSSGGSTGAGPINTLPAQTGNYDAHSYSFFDLGSITPLPDDLSAPHTIGFLLGPQFSIDGLYNVNDPYYGADPTGVAPSEAAFQNAYEAACTAASLVGYAPEVYIPHGEYLFQNYGLKMDCLGHQVNVVGDGENVSVINVAGNFTGITNAGASALTGVGTITTAPLVSGGSSNNQSMNWATGAAPAGYWWGDLSSVLYTENVPNPINGATGLTIRGWFNIPSNSGTHIIMDSRNDQGTPTTIQNNSLTLTFSGTTLTCGVRTGSAPAQSGQPTTATVTFTTSIVQYFECDYDAATGHLAVFTGVPGSTTIHGTAVALTGNVLQIRNELWDLGVAQEGVITGPSMVGALFGLDVEKTAAHTCPSGTCTNFTAPSTPFTANPSTTILLMNGTDSTNTQTYAVDGEIPITYPTGNTQMQVISATAAQDRQAFIEKLSIAGNENIGIFNEQRPQTRNDQVEVDGSFGGYAAIYTTNNVYDAEAGQLFLGQCGRYCYKETNDSSMWVHHSKLTFALENIYGSCNISDSIITVGGPATVAPIHCTENLPTYTDMRNMEDDDESGYNGPLVFLDEEGGTFHLTGNIWVAGSGNPAIGLPFARSSQPFNLQFDSLTIGGSSPYVSNLDSIDSVTANNVIDDSTGLQVTATALCGAANFPDCHITSQVTPPEPVLVPPQPTGTVQDVVNQGSSPTVVTASSTTSGVYQFVIAAVYSPTNLTASVVPPSGWHIAAGCPNGPSGFAGNQSYVLYHLNGGGEASSNSFTWFGNSADFYQYAVSGTAGIDGVATCTGNESSPLAVLAPPGTTASSDLVFALGGMNAAGTTYSGPAATQWVDATSGYFGLGEYYYGSGATATFFSAASNNNIGAQVAFRGSQVGYPIVSTTPPAVTVTNAPSASGQSIISTGTTTANWAAASFPSVAESSLSSTACSAGQVVIATSATANPGSGTCASGSASVLAVCQSSTNWLCM